jgi:spermidine synthase
VGPALLPFVFFFSGVAALLFETLWFRQAGLALGNSVWASSLITASFMAGLALGSAACARWSGYVRRPVRVYATLEVAVALSGAGIVLALPRLTPLVAALARPLLAHIALLNVLRGALAFSLFALPATAMGCTLPLLVEALGGERPAFGRAFGRLYGWNTLGAVAGALLGEMALIERCGVRGTVLVAAALNLTAAGGALAAIGAGDVRPVASTRTDGPTPPADARLFAVLGAAALAGAVVLALETVWFRFLLMFVCGTTMAFAAMLAVVLAAISLGALAASVWLARRPEAHRHAAAIAFAAGTAAVVSYAAFPAVTSRPCGLSVLLVAAPLVFPVCVLSGALFTLVGSALRPRFGSAIDTAAVVTLANTLGALVGGLAGGFVLLPRLGVEGSVFIAALAYGLAAVALAYGLAAPADGGEARVRPMILGLGLAFALAMAAFPFGLMRRTYLPRMLARWTSAGSRVVAVREGLTETSAWLTDTLWNEPIAHRLVTNGFSMAGRGYNFDRYTRLFAYWPAAVRPQPRRVLLISYGVGSTAGALTTTPGVAAIDVVDISRDVLEVSRLGLPGPRQPLDDPRVAVHVEDGRQFLVLTPARYDLITAEPPPPRNAGIATLYSREYFHLLRERLEDGGVATYWLPVHSLAPREAWAITRAFCDAFPDCSLWAGIGLDWMLAGTRGVAQAPDEAGFASQWRDPVRAAEMASVGFEGPERLGATFLADAAQLAGLMGTTPPLVDDFPYRLLPWEGDDSREPFWRLMETGGARRRFEESAWVARIWPARVRAETLARFDDQALLNRLSVLGTTGFSFAAMVDAVQRVPRRFTTLWLLGVNEDVVRAARLAERRGIAAPLVDHALGASALAEGDDREAAVRFGRVLDRVAGASPLVLWRAFALCRAGEVEAAALALRTMADRVPAGDREGAAALPPACRGLPEKEKP